MATTHWRKGYSVTQLFTQDDANWSFHQLARLLLGMGVKEDDLLETLAQRVEFIGSLSRSLPAGEIRNIEIVNETVNEVTNEEREENRPNRKSRQNTVNKHTVECSYYNLTGLDGPLAEPFSDMIREDIYRGEGAMAAFLNIFNNRIHALRFLVHAKTNYTLTNSKACDNNLGQFLLSLSGHYYATQRALHGQQDDSLLALSGHLANCRMTFPTIRKLFDTVLSLPVITMNSLVGRWLPVQDTDHLRLGCANHHLGKEATLGKKVWDQQAIVEWVLGPIDHQRLQSLVPEGRSHHKLRDLVSWVSERRVDCQITLVCQSERQRKDNATTLSDKIGTTNRLGYGAALLSHSSKNSASKNNVSKKSVSKNSTTKKIRFMLDMVG